MSRPLRPGASNWRRAATVVLAAAWPRWVPAAPSRPPLPAEGFRLLLLERSGKQNFLPGAHVFPGGVVDAADRSSDWLRLFAPHHWPPRFGLGPAPPQRVVFPGLSDSLARAVDGDAGALPDDVAFRICAIREAFEEAGVLLLRPRGPLAAEREPGLALAPSLDLADWRSRVRRDAQHFLRLCAHLDCTPNIWALHNWSGWFTPFRNSDTLRFETLFFLCCLREPPQVLADSGEIVNCQWLSPLEATESFLSEKVWFAPPQFYEIRRLENFSSLSDLHRFCVDRELEGAESWLSILLITADTLIQLLPGDEMYVEDAHYLENTLVTEKKSEDITKEGKRWHRIVINGWHDYDIHVTVKSKYKHIYPKSFVVSKSRL